MKGGLPNSYNQNKHPVISHLDQVRLLYHVNPQVLPFIYDNIYPTIDHVTERTVFYERCDSHLSLVRLVILNNRASYHDFKEPLA